MLTREFVLRPPISTWRTAVRRWVNLYETRKPSTLSAADYGVLHVLDIGIEQPTSVTLTCRLVEKRRTFARRPRLVGTL